MVKYESCVKSPLNFPGGRHTVELTQLLLFPGLFRCLPEPSKSKPKLCSSNKQSSFYSQEAFNLLVLDIINLRPRNNGPRASFWLYHPVPSVKLIPAFPPCKSFDNTLITSLNHFDFRTSRLSRRIPTDKPSPPLVRVVFYAF